ncbi:hypothetical protein HAHE_37920 [Haloferula helveola]|uniref:LysM domain-containing protein n=1 Tax=Haloferula helveola TaxID=490095 RepID=A0ABN6HBP5_9BACT|nr:hypothetical protein HAHE_37920 [Haloferula helveola]
MKTFARFAVLPALAFGSLVDAGEISVTELQQRCDEQERQIRNLELENQRLRSRLGEITPAPDLAPVSTEEKEETVTPPETTRTEPAAPIHVIRSGESLSKIAKQHGTTTAVLAKLNGIKNPGMIREGQRLKLPADTSVASESSKVDTVEGTHRVKSGETFYSIARTYGLSVDRLQESNPGVDYRSLRVGQELKLSARKAPEPTESALTEVARTEDPAGADEASQTVMNRPVVRRVRVTDQISFGDFAKQHGMDPGKLNALNGLHLEPKTPLATGSELYVSAQPLE